MKRKWAKPTLLILLGLISWVQAAVVQKSLPRNSPENKASLRKKLVRENRQWERELSLGGRLSLSKSVNSTWGIHSLNKRFAQERGNSRIVGSVMTQQVSLMKLNKKVFDFIGEHGLFLKHQSDKGNAIRFTLNPRLNGDKSFSVKIGKNGSGYGVRFSSKSPYMTKSMHVATAADLDQKVGKFLGSSLRKWARHEDRILKLDAPRKLLKSDEVPEIMEELAGDVMELKEVEGEENTWDLVVREDEKPIARITITKEESGDEVLEMSNEEIAGFKHMQKVANRTIGDADQKDDLILFFRPHFDEFLAKYEQWKLDRTDVTEIAAFIQEEAAKVGYIGKLEETKVEKEEQDNMIILRKWKEQDHSLFFQASVYNVNEDYMGVHIVQGNNEMQLEIPSTMNQEQKNDTRNALALFMTQRDFSDMVDYKEALILFKQIADTMGCEKIKTEKEDEDSALFLFEHDDGCPFNLNHALLTKVDFDGMRYIHFLLDNDYFKGEHFITMTTKNIFRDNMTKVLKDSKAEIAVVSDAYKKSQDPDVVTMERLEKMVKEVLGDKVSEAHEAERKIFKAKVLGREVVVAKIQEFEGEGPSLFKVTTFDVNVDSEVKQARAHHEFLLYANNGYNQLDVLEAELTKIAADIPAK